MYDTGLRTALILAAGLLAVGFLFLTRPEYFASPSELGALVVAELVLAAACKYREAFFPVLMAAFLWAGTDLPLRAAWLQGRWFVLILGALVGVAVYLKDRQHHFGTFHLVAFFCILSAIVSASVSAYPEESLLKAASLLLLFVYAGAGGRLAVPVFQQEKFFRGLVTICETVTYITAVFYFLFHFEVFGNPNSLGAVMGVVVVPSLFWGVVASRSTGEWRRRGFTLLLAMVMLLSSFSRASCAAAVLSCLMIGISARQYRLIAKGVAATIVLALVVATLVPLPEDAPRWNGSDSVASLFLYKGKPEGGFAGSRQGPWQQTLTVMKEHPWFGSGFGTSVTLDDVTQFALMHAHFDSRIVREHGNSYLAITEWVGLLGVVPFYSLIVLTALNVRRAFSRLRESGDVFAPAVPVAAMVGAALVHATFEDWMFAVGYYLCVFFWAMAFILVDVLRAPAVADSNQVVVLAEPQFLATASGQ